MVIQRKKYAGVPVRTTWNRIQRKAKAPYGADAPAKKKNRDEGQWSRYLVLGEKEVVNLFMLQAFFAI